MKPLVVIPSRYEPERLRSLLLSALLDCDVVVLDNGHEPQLVSLVVPTFEVIDTRGMSIYAMWNLGWALAEARGYDAVALLNDDVRILPGTVPLLARALGSRRGVGVVYPDWPRTLDAGLPKRLELRATAGTVTNRGMTGFAFMFRADLPVAPFDEGFNWWYGDDAFEQGVRHAGFTVCRVVGLPCEHESDSEANDWARRPDLRELAQADRARWEAMPA